MKIVRVVIGIFSIMALFIIFIQAYRWNVADPNGIKGVLVGILLFIAGILGCIMKTKKKMGIIAGVLYIAAAILSIVFLNVQSYLITYAIASAVAGVVFLVSCFLMKDMDYGKKPKLKK